MYMQVEYIRFFKPGLSTLKQLSGTSKMTQRCSTASVLFLHPWFLHWKVMEENEKLKLFKTICTFPVDGG